MFHKSGCKVKVQRTSHRSRRQCVRAATSRVGARELEEGGRATDSGGVSGIILEGHEVDPGYHGEAERAAGLRETQSEQQGPRSCWTPQAWRHRGETDTGDLGLGPLQLNWVTCVASWSQGKSPTQSGGRGLIDHRGGFLAETDNVWLQRFRFHEDGRGLVFHTIRHWQSTFVQDEGLSFRRLRIGLLLHVSCAARSESQSWVSKRFCVVAATGDFFRHGGPRVSNTLHALSVVKGRVIGKGMARWSGDMRGLRLRRRG